MKAGYSGHFLKNLNSTYEKCSITKTTKIVVIVTLWCRKVILHQMFLHRVVALALMVTAVALNPV
jgi:hypothetical protein